MWKFAAAGAVIVLVVIAGFSLIDGSGQGEINAQAAFLAPASADISGFSRAVDPYTWQFPRDHGAHDTFQTEWWYYTGNLQTVDGRHFGYQFTIFRRAIVPTASPELTPQAVNTASDWRTRQVYMAHFTLSDIAGGQFYQDERYSRGGAGLAGSLPDNAHPDEAYRVWLENWEIAATDANAASFQMTANSGTDTAQNFSIDFTLTSSKPPALHGENGLSPKSDQPGNASYYYSLSHLLTEGTITLNGIAYAVSGTTWMDHEFSTSALGTKALGWDWFGLQFDDGRDLMVGKIRLAEGGREPAFGGLLINADGTTRSLKASDFTIEPIGSWQSPHTGAAYPSGWTITIQGAAVGQAEPLVFTVEPLLDDQELHSGAIAYWEGAVKLSGAVTGYGYAELTGYTSVMTGRF